MSDNRNRGVFDQMRLALTLGVIYTHAYRFIDNDSHREINTLLFGIRSKMGFGVGDLCVDLFFSISGYLIVGAWMRNPDPLSFVRNRVLRIYPGFIVSSILCLTFFAALAVPDFPLFIRGLDPKHVIKQLLTLGGPSEPVYAGTHHPYANGSTWTIRLEMLCYAVALAIGMSGRSLRRIQALWVATYFGAFALVVLFVSAPGISLRLPGPLHDEYLLRFLACFAGGAILQLHGDLLARLRKFTGLFVLAFFAAMFFESALPVVLPLILPPMTILIGTSPFLERRLPVFRNDYSYGTFVYAWPVQKLLIKHFPQMGVALHIPLAIVITLGFAWLSWTFVEKTSLRFKSSGPSRVREGNG